MQVPSSLIPSPKWPGNEAMHLVLLRSCYIEVMMFMQGRGGRGEWRGEGRGGRGEWRGGGRGEGGGERGGEKGEGGGEKGREESGGERGEGGERREERGRGESLGTWFTHYRASRKASEKPPNSQF